MDKHIRRNNRRGYHENTREGNRAFPAIDTSGWTLKEIRERIRGQDRRDDDETEETRDDGL